jgi:hypothetical protein
MAPEPEAMLLAVEKLGVGAGPVRRGGRHARRREAARGAGPAGAGLPGALGEAEPELFEGLPVAHALAPETLTRAWRDGLMTTAAE